MDHHLDCECGDQVAVRESDAGTTALCHCGRTVVIPSLHKLRRRAGVYESSLPPDRVVETLLLAGKLPEEADCVLCGLSTDASICCTTECERSFAQDGQLPWWVYLLGLLTFGWFGVFVVNVSEGSVKVRGTDRIFPLPLRVCDACQHQLTSPEKVKAALSLVPLYRRLLNKYPNAQVSLPPR